jgi:DNA-directed RNA polymerase subunit beta'
MAYQNGDVSIHAPIKVRVERTFAGKTRAKVINATVGRIIFNEPIPQDLGFIDRTDPEHMFDYEINFRADRKMLERIIKACISRHGFARASELLDNIKALGFKYSTRGAITISISDMTVPDAKKRLIRETEQKVAEITMQYRRGWITDDERYRLVVREWEQTTKDVTDALQDMLDEFNPIFMMANSGARGSMVQIRQLAGMRGLMANTAGKTIEIPIKANFREGLTMLEYFTASRGARKGSADTALRTADSGYLTRRLVDVSQDVIIREHDCGTHDGIIASAFEENGSVVRTFGDAINGRFPSEDVLDPSTNELLFSRDRMLSTRDADTLALYGITSLRVRTVLDCEALSGVCAKCYGQNLATGEPVSIGEAVGVIAAQSIGEPGTQLTMRTFHTGGIAGDDITQGLPRVEELFEARKPKKMSILAEIPGIVGIEETRKNAMLAITVTSEEDGEVRLYQTPYSAGVNVKAGDRVEKGERLTDGALNPHDIMRILSKDAAQTYLIAEVQRVYRQQGIDINDKHIEVIVRQMMRKVRIEEGGDTDLLSGTTSDILEVRRINAEIEARTAAGETCADEVTGEPRELLPATHLPLLMGITKASLATDSFLSAASFQETTKVLTEAAIKGKVDHLLGLKENVIIGKLIPAGSGLAIYRGAESEYTTITPEGDEEFDIDLSLLQQTTNAI